MTTALDWNCPACGDSRTRSSSAGAGLFEGHSYAYRRCLACGTVFVAPPPPPGLIGQMYAPAYLGEHYGDGGNGELDGELLRTVDLVAKRAPGGAVLDIGCGMGAFMRVCRERALEVEGYELNEETARTVARAAGLPVHHGRLDHVPVRFDAVHMADVLEHLPDPLSMLEQAVRLLKPNGIVIGRGPLEGQATLFDLLMRARRRLKSTGGPVRVVLPPWHLVSFSLAGWRALSGRVGLRIVEESISEVQWPAPRSGIRGLTKRASIRLSHSALGRRLEFANRVVSIWSRSAK